MSAKTLSLIVSLCACFLAAASQTTESKEEDCVCVKFYLCNIDQKVLQHGAGVLDPRIEVCESDEVCCFLQTNETEEHSDDRQKKPVTRPTTPTTTTSEPVAVTVTEPTDFTLPTLPTVTPFRPVPLTPIMPRSTGCGLRRNVLRNLFDDRIASDLPAQASFGEFPWMIMIYREVNKRQKYVCGGSLIHESAVLTAAHCLFKPNAEGKEDLGELKVRGGEWDISGTYEPLPHEDRSVARVIPHPNYDKNNLLNDIALLILDKPFKKTVIIDALCAIPEDKVNRINTTQCIVSGWGQVSFEDENMQQILRYVTMPIVERNACQEKLRTTRLSKYFILHESFICAGGIPGQDSCTGDGGGPLICPLKDQPGRFVQMGIVSWGIGCASEIPGVYANVPAYFQWINSVIINELS